MYACWIEDLKLHESDHVALNGGEELTENIINAAQAIMNMQFLNFCGFQDTALAHNLNFVPVSPDKPSIQILHIGAYLPTVTCLQLRHVYRYVPSAHARGDWQSF